MEKNKKGNRGNRINPWHARYLPRDRTVALWRLVKVAFSVFFASAVVFAIVISGYVVYAFRQEVAYDMRATKMQLTSFVFAPDKNGNFVEYDRVYNTGNRVWVDFSAIPQHMKDAIVAIEDKRFFRHFGIDPMRTAGAVLGLFFGGRTYGGSTLTQQTVKNLTGDSQVSMTRKLKEITRALRLERDLSKDEILELYLNVVNFGAGCLGVEAAAKTYFGKHIGECSVAQCAAIAGITQNPTAYNPLLHPEKNRERREVVLREMLSQKKILKDQFDEAMAESKNMEFYGKSQDDGEEAVAAHVRNWYMEAMFQDIIRDLMREHGMSKAAAQDMLYSQGLQIYSAMDIEAQKIAEDALKDDSLMPPDKKLELGFVMMDLKGRILATLGSRSPKTANLVFDRANFAKRQTGSAMKPISVYAPAIDAGLLHYSSVVADKPLPDFYGLGKPGPGNWYKSYKGDVLLPWAIAQSSNATAVQTLARLTCEKSFEFLTKKLGFRHLDNEDRYSMSSLALGGTHGGATVREMTAAYQIFGNGGIYNEPFTYFYVLDRSGKILLDNRDKLGTRVLKAESAFVMNRLLRGVVLRGTGRGADIPDLEVILKTGTTNDDKDVLCVGCTPYVVAGIRMGYDSPKRIHGTAYAKRFWKYMMEKFHVGKEKCSYAMPPGITEALYCTTTGNLAIPGACPAEMGYYLKSNMPKVCMAHSSLAQVLPPQEASAEIDEIIGAAVEEQMH